MNNPAHQALTASEKDRIQAALQKALPNGPHVRIGGEKLTRVGDFAVPVEPLEYPEEMFQFMHALASAEISLRDSGLKVTLFPAVRQRMLVVATPAGDKPIAYRSADGLEYLDLAKILKVTEKDLSSTDITGYAYDNDADLAEALTEAKSEFPDADFSRVA